MLGTDYEVFVRSHAKNRAVPATIFGLGGKTGEHTPLYLDGAQVGTVHRDNLMLEICSEPRGTALEFSTAVGNALKGAQEYVSAFNDDLYITRNTTEVFGERALRTRAAGDIGCDADYLSERDSARRTPVTAGVLGNVRCAGGHIHVSYNTQAIPPWAAAVLFDLLVGIPHQRSLNTTRAPFYGLATLHRPTQYPDGSTGVEYRVLDSFWVHDPDVRLRVLQRAELVQTLLNGQHVSAVQQLVAAHERLVPKNTILASFDGSQLQLEVVRTLQETGGHLMESYYDSI